MPIKIDKYLKERNPPRPLELFPPRVLQFIEDGFCSYLKAGVTILHLKEETLNIELVKKANQQFDRLEAHYSDRKFNHFCEWYRKKNDRKCCEYDANKAIEYWRDKGKGPELYPCHHGLMDMTYPLKLRGQTIAVVFAGQMISLKTFDQIANKIKAEVTDSDNLINSLELKDEQEINDTFEHFKDFGKMLQNLLDRLYEQRWEAARHEFLNDVVRELTMTSAADLGKWKETPNEVLKSFLLITGFLKIKVYSRRNSRYELWGIESFKNEPSSKGLIQLTHLRPITFLPDATLSSMQDLLETGIHRDDYIELKKMLDLDETNTIFFLYKHQEQFTPPLDTLIVLEGTLASEDKKFVKDFCETVAMRVRVTRFVLVLQEERKKFETRVSNVGHTTKTPLQIASYLLSDLKRNSLIKGGTTDEVNALIDKSIRNIKIAKAYMRDIYISPTTKGREESLRKLIETSIEKSRELAQERENKITFEIEPIFSPVVREQGTLTIAFINLLDNATKYSNPNSTIFVYLKSLGKETALIEIVNSGQGIPEAHLETVKESNMRWVPPDLPPNLKKRRPGTGLGLAMAIQYVEDHGGWLDIQSRPEHPKYINDLISHWVTTVTIAVPLIR
jgi:signal transduction histidine kinase/ligand-binding sensor protein